MTAPLQRHGRRERSREGGRRGSSVCIADEVWLWRRGSSQRLSGLRQRRTRRRPHPKRRRQSLVLRQRVAPHSVVRTDDAAGRDNRAVVATDVDTARGVRRRKRRRRRGGARYRHLRVTLPHWCSPLCHCP
jgi:hypothetical protein